MKSRYYSKFNGREGEVIAYAHTHTLWETADKFDVGFTSHERFHDWLKDVSGDSEICVKPEIGNKSLRELSDYIADALVRKIKAQDEEILQLRKQLQREQIEQIQKEDEVRVSGYELLKILKLEADP